MKTIPSVKNMVLRRKAADLIEEAGWHQGDYRSDKTGGYCLVGALLVVTGWQSREAYYPPLDSTVSSGTRNQFNSVFTEISMELPGGRVSISPALWNDEPGRTKEEVLTLLRGPEPEAGFTTPALEPFYVPEPKPLEWPGEEPAPTPVEEPAVPEREKVPA